MKFFIPHVSPADTEAVYAKIKATLHSQLRLPIEDRRIQSLSYTNSRKRWVAEIGELEQQERQYEILAILDAKQYIVFTRSIRGGSGPIILVDKDEVTAVVEFDPVPVPVTPE